MLMSDGNGNVVTVSRDSKASLSPSVPSWATTPAADKKYDTGKAMVGQMKKDFGKALLAVADVTLYGVQKYNSPGSWKEVKDALSRYEDALGRHDLQCTYEKRDLESGRLHAAHRAWNALATLQMIIEAEELQG